MSADDRSTRPAPAAALARAHGAFNVVGGVWPLLNRRSFEAIFGQKYDRWLQFTVAGLLAGNGLVQLTAARTPAGLASARRLGLTTAGWLLTIDLIYVPKGTIRIDAAMEIGWLAAWQGRYGRIEST
ncbi:hypothetical protein [Nocardia sp. GTS18]|uniref:hypothetical protein n=1 Tax=Nocardia sp. GTS18 TaxID=1778064 RepID=UPI0015EED64E|nr:hypothetical protein [Nocardia sp. GTS18]